MASRNLLRTVAVTLLAIVLVLWAVVLGAPLLVRMHAKLQSTAACCIARSTPASILPCVCPRTSQAAILDRSNLSSLRLGAGSSQDSSSQPKRDATAIAAAALLRRYNEIKAENEALTAELAALRAGAQEGTSSGCEPTQVRGVSQAVVTRGAPGSCTIDCRHTFDRRQ